MRNPRTDAMTMPEQAKSRATGPAAGTTSSAPQAPLVSADSIWKSFGNVAALRGASLQVHAGRSHALVGRNGAGKSTMVAMLTGLLNPDEGRVCFEGEPAPAAEDVHAWRRLVACVPQRPNIVPELSVAENLHLNRYPKSSFGRIDRKAMHRDATTVLEEWKVAVSPSASAAALSVDQRQLVEIARALATGVKFVVLDEPTAALESSEVNRFFNRIRELQEQGVTFLFISHHLQEIYEICQDVTVFRDGLTVLSAPVDEVPKARLIAAMVGDEVASPIGNTAAHTPRGPDRTGDLTALELDGVTIREGAGIRGAVENVSLKVGAGEVVGLAGLKGSGKGTLGDALGGLVAVDSGVVTVDRAVADLRTPKASIRSRIGSVPQDRHATGFVPQLGVDENITMTIPNRVNRRFGAISRSAQQGEAKKLMASMEIVASSPQQQVATLSGGNQQKVVIGRAIASNPRILVLQEPTMGVDIASKNAIWGILEGARESGLGVLVISDEYDELSNCSRIYVIVRGRIVDEIHGVPSETELTAAIEGE